MLKAILCPTAKLHLKTLFVQVVIIGENFFEGLQVAFGSTTVWPEVRESNQNLFIIGSF